MVQTISCGIHNMKNVKAQKLSHRKEPLPSLFTLLFLCNTGMKEEIFGPWF